MSGTSGTIISAVLGLSDASVGSLVNDGGGKIVFPCATGKGFFRQCRDNHLEDFLHPITNNGNPTVRTVGRQRGK